MDGDSDLSDLNENAWKAALGFSERWDQALIDLLRSDEPIHPWVRKALADAIQGKNTSGVRLKMTGIKEMRSAAAAVETRLLWVRIGEWIEKEIQGGKTRASAIEAASIRFPRGDKSCDQALDYYRRYRRWRESLGANHPFWGLSEGSIQRKFHILEHYGTPPDKE